MLKSCSSVTVYSTIFLHESTRGNSVHVHDTSAVSRPVVGLKIYRQAADPLSADGQIFHAMLICCGSLAGSLGTCADGSSTESAPRTS